MTLVKVCCIASAAEAELAIEHGASALGLVSEMPSGPGVLDEASIASVAREVGDAADTFLLTSRVTASALAEQHTRCKTTTLQLVDRVAPGERDELRAMLPGVRLVQVVHVIGPESVDEALSAAEFSDALLLDSGNPNLDTKVLGGTGRAHDWSVSTRIVRESPVPVLLAGGLTPENVREAIETVRPHGVDLCTGVRTEGRLDAAKLERFMSAVRSV